MKAISLRELVRQPKTVKKMTAAGKSVRVTDNGHPLWLVVPDIGADKDDDEETRTLLWEEHFADLLQGTLPKPLSPTLSQAVLEGRGNR